MAFGCKPWILVVVTLFALVGGVSSNVSCETADVDDSKCVLQTPIISYLVLKLNPAKMRQIAVHLVVFCLG